MSELVVIQRLLLVTLLAGAIGYERERHGRAAGFRTHILVGLGSCLVMLTALYQMEELAGRMPVDPTRLPAQVVSGIGFLGAGTIIRFRASIRGLTTAAGLWAAAGIGLAVGAGFVLGAVTATAIVLVTLFGLGGLERRMRPDWQRTLIVEAHSGQESVAKIRQVMLDYGAEIGDLTLQPGDSPDVSRVAVRVRLLSERDEELIQAEVLRLEGIQRARWVKSHEVTTYGTP